MAQIRRRYADPIIYELGTDISQEKYEQVMVAMTDWFVEWRNTNEPALLARQLFKECMEGKTSAGLPWFSAANSSLSARVRSKCRFDMDSLKPLRSSTDKRRLKKEKERKQALLKKLKDNKDTLIPDEIRREVKKDLTYGDDPRLSMTSSEQQQWDALYQDYKDQHPELSAISATAELKMLCDAHIMMERHRLQALSGKNADTDMMEATVKRFSLLKKSLGIHPDQIKNKTKGLFDVSVGEAVARFKDLGEEEYRNLRERYWVEELIQLYQMFNTPNAAGTGYQLDEIGLYGLTRSKPESCPKCNTKVFSGLTIDEIEKYLVSKNAMVLMEGLDDKNADGVVEGDNEWAPDQPSDRKEDGGGGAPSDDSSMAEIPGHSLGSSERGDSAPAPADDSL